MSLTDDANRCVRYLVRTALGLPEQSVRPANQVAPAGAQTDQFATVLIMGDEEIGTVNRAIEDDGHGGLEEVLYQNERFTARVQFFKSLKRDAAGIAKYSSDAFDLARRLPRVLDFEANIELMQQLGLGYETASRALNLAGVSDATWESRGSIEITFAIFSREAMATSTFASVPVGLQVLEPDGVIQTRTINEVSP